MRHDNMSLQSSQHRSAGQSCRMISGRMRHDATGRFLIGQAKDRVTGPAGFKRKAILEVLALQTESTAKLLVQMPRIDNGCQQHIGANSLGRLTNIRKIQTELYRGRLCD
jgi:hypothetical protein